jgi:hypothetical protein
MGPPVPPDQLGWRPLGETAGYQIQIPWRVRRTFVSAALILMNSFRKDEDNNFRSACIDARTFSTAISSHFDMYLLKVVRWYSYRKSKVVEAVSSDQ